MNSWAAEGKYDCNFLCVCVLGDRSAFGLSKEMSKESQLTHCVNGFIDSMRDMPTYGQLGCKGFIVLDAEHNVVSDATPAFMEVRDLAFDHVESLLEAVVAKRSPPKVLPGDFVTLAAPPKELAKLKGAPGVCVKVAGDHIQMAFISQAMRGKMMELPSTAVVKGMPKQAGGGGGGGCGPDGCGPPIGNGSCGPGSCGEGNCGAGSCADGKGSEQGCDGGCDGSGAIDEAFVDIALDLVSVKVPSMDEEHAECAAAFKKLVAGRDRAALEEVLRELSEHFAHEEALFVEHDFGAHENENLSARKSHMDDHKRILDKARGALGATKQGQSVRADYIKELLQDFHDHTTRYDTQYAEPLSAKGAR